jgi:hypothetical protein
MAFEIKKLAELEYNELITIAVIENDEDLTSIFKEDIALSFPLLKTIAQNDELNAQTKVLLKDIFEAIILTSNRYISNYVRFGGKVIGDVIIADLETTEDNVEEPIIEAIVEKVEKPKKVKADKVLPKWYGKQRLEKEIAEQGGKATPTQRAMLEINDLKNMYSNLLARGIKDLETGSNLLSDADCRKIASVVKLAKQQLSEILKKK